MQKHNNILSAYISSLKNQINGTSEFTKTTEEWLSGPEAADLFFTDAANRIQREDLGLPTLFTNSQKILTIIKEILQCSNIYVSKLTAFSLVLQELKTLKDLSDDVQI